MESVFFSEVVYIFLGVPITFVLWLFMALFLVRRQSRQAVVLNKNLERIGKRWSFERENVVEFDDPADGNPYKTYWIIGFALAIFSWLGFMLSLVAWASLIWVRSRRERFIFSSELAQKDPLPVEQMTAILERMPS